MRTVEKKGICLLHIANVKTYLLHENRLIVTKQILHAFKMYFVLNSQIAKGENTSFDGGDELACIYSHFNRKLFNAKKVIECKKILLRCFLFKKGCKKVTKE